MQPKTHKASFLIPGLISYENEGEGVWLLQKSSVDACIKTFMGKPVQIGHEPTDIVCGYVANSYFDEEKGIYVADFFLLDDKAESMVNSRQYFPSCAYTVLNQGGGGVYNNIAYSTEILELRFDHLAIVDNPRYTCGVFFSDEKPNLELKAINSGGKMAFLSKTAKNEGGEKKEETPAATPPAAPQPAEQPKEQQTAANAVVEIDGEKVNVADLADLYRKSKTSENEGEQVLGEDEMLDIDGEQVQVKDLIALWKSQAAQTPPPPPAQNSGEEKEEEKQAENKKTATNGIKRIQKAAQNSAPPMATNSRQPMESKAAYNKRMTELVFGKGGV